MKRLSVCCVLAASFAGFVHAQTPARAPSYVASPNIFTAFQEQLGLKLEPSTTAVEVVVIDQIERPQAP